MKKTLGMLGMAVVALTSCTQNEVLDVAENRVIGFETFVGKSTRAAVPINQAQATTGNAMDNLYQFWVYGYDNNTQLFTGTDESAKVYYSNDLHGFTYDNHEMWHLGHTYSFAAYSNGNTPLVSALASPPQNTNVSQTPEKVSFQEIKAPVGDPNAGKVVGSQLVFDDYTVGDYDLLAAIVPVRTLAQEATTVSAVPLYFQHMLSLINVRLENNTDEEYILIDDIQFPGFVTDDCTYSIDNNDNKTISWMNTGSTGTYTFKGTPVSVDEMESATEDTKNNEKNYLAPGKTLTLTYFVIPQSNSALNAISLKMHAYKKEGSNFVKATNEPVTKKISLAVKDHTNWLPGYVYNYTGSLEGAAHYIHFHVNSVEDWSSKSVDVNGTGSNVY